ncbi:MAG: hydroxymethylbilane synthase [Sandaracinaceae bacterium]|nr:hydroxymethylbilane synthase [Sandaracinaceae bacterium]
MKLRVATRKSALALTQTRWVIDALKALTPNLEVEEVQIVTEGDRIQNVSLAKFGGKGLFVSEVEAALADGRADFAVHSMKDLPAKLGEGLAIACVPKREDARDVLITKDGLELDALTAGARIGTSSLRRSCQLRAFRNDLQYKLLRGNVDTRLRKLDEGEYEAIVLAHAGLLRLGLASRPLWPIPAEVCLPAVGQGALALEARVDDVATNMILAKLEDSTTRTCVEAERAFLAMLDGGCHAPMAAHARIEDGERLRIDAMVGAMDGSSILQAGSEHYCTGLDEEELRSTAIRIGRTLARSLLQQGAASLLEEARAEAMRVQQTQS